jgi:signal transduction histidine kinase
MAAVKGKRGLGLISMGERLRLVGGQIAIESGEARGTQIEVRVPLPRADAGDGNR